MTNEHKQHPTFDYQRTLDEIATWAAQESNVRAVVLTGSAAAQSQHPLSDRDIELHVQDTSPSKNRTTGGHTWAMCSPWNG